MIDATIYRNKRLKLQSELDLKKSALDRNRLGQFATPSSLADSVVKLGISGLPSKAAISFMDPAFGLGSFYDSLLTECGKHSISRSFGIEIDDHYFNPSKALWQESALNLIKADFTQLSPPNDDEDKFNLLICNPPYVRHHHMELAEKTRLSQKVFDIHSIHTSKLMGLYGYFLLLSHQWMKNDGIAVWLIPTEFMDVNYGHAIKQYLCEEVTLLKIHTFQPEDVQFDDALVSSTVVMLKKRKPTAKQETIFSLGGTLDAPKFTNNVKQHSLNPQDKWSKLAKGLRKADSLDSVKFSEIFNVKRGIATGSNSFFILSDEKAKSKNIPTQFLQPILPSSRYLTSNVIEAKEDGSPAINNSLYLLNCNLPEATVKRDYPDLWKYLEEGKAAGVADGYICRNRSPWYKQEARLSPDMVVGYMGRSRDGKVPFKFYLNKSEAIAANSYLMIYLKPEIKDKLSIHFSDLSRIVESISLVTEEMFLDKGRSYGGGLHKLEPKELGNIPLYGLGDIFAFAK